MYKQRHTKNVLLVPIHFNTAVTIYDSHSPRQVSPQYLPHQQTGSLPQRSRLVPPSELCGTHTSRGSLVGGLSFVCRLMMRGGGAVPDLILQPQSSDLRSPSVELAGRAESRALRAGSARCSGRGSRTDLRKPCLAECSRCPPCSGSPRDR